MKYFPSLALPFLLLCACGSEQPGQGAASTESASQAAAPAANVADAAASEGEARDINQRYKGGLERMDSKGDLSAAVLKSEQQGGDGSEHDGHDHDGHDHGETPKQDGSALSTAALAATNSAQNKGRINMLDNTPQVKDFGKMRQGEMGEFDFLFVSAGDEPLVVTGVKPSCGCTKAELVLVDAEGNRSPYVKGDPIPVGDRFALESEINTDGRQGRFNANISIYANDARGTFSVRLTAEIEPVLMVKPSSTIYFGRITTADRVEEMVTVTSTQGEPFQLTPTQVPVEPLQLEYTALHPDENGRSNEWEVKIILGPNADVGMRNYPLNFKSDLEVANPKYPSPDGSPQYHMFMLNTQAQVVGMISAEPTFVTFGMVHPGEPVERSLRLEVHDDFKLGADIPTSVEGLQGQEFPYADAFEVSIEPLEDGKAADVKVRLVGLPDDLNGSLGGVLKIKVGHPFMDELQIRFSAVCRPAPPARGGQK